MSNVAEFPNAETAPEAPAMVGGVSAQALRQYIERVERLEEEKQGIAEDIKEVFAEAKGNGFDVKTMRQILRIRKMDDNDRREQEDMLQLYKDALGMVD